MENSISSKIRTKSDGELEFMASDNKWYPLDQADMAHLTDSVSWWKVHTGRYYGASPQRLENGC
ncbi:hypothetical protein PDL09_03360 [Bacillus cereus]|uniref:hypothetical protein n=1 Tax=Bacillus cereus TaxID=1396 RepID=UPI001F0C90C1|nr:hypothetical protein [Bacillus cereus]MDA1846229.1 hypothetical protein [Bacillus cereus]